MLPAALAFVRCVDETASLLRNNRIDRILPTDNAFGESVAEKNVTSDVNAEPALIDSLVKLAAPGAEKVTSSTDVRANAEYQPAASDGLPG